MRPATALALLALSAAPPAAALEPAAPAGAPGPAAAAEPESPLRLAARLASRRFPRARWRLGEARLTDVTYDGQADVVLLGVDAAALVVAVVEGPIGGGSRVHALRFPSGVEARDAICGTAAAVQANTERPDPSGLEGLDAEARQRIVAAGDADGHGLVLVHAHATGYCEPFHLVYDGERLVWWRPPP